MRTAEVWLKIMFKALKWYRRAAEQDQPQAQNNLGYMYENGEGLPRDYQEAFKWYRKAADKGDPEAQNNVELMYKNGFGVPRDYTRSGEVVSESRRPGL
jgi:TPR repeat protein